MTDAIVHRGPDDSGSAVLPEDGAAVGMRRLSIVDLGGGHQPMWSDGDQHAVVFNGEIYNAPELRRELVAVGQRFRTDHSDTEVVVHGFARWGHDLWRRLNGMFAVAIWDRRRRALVVARDRFGKKPLYIARCSGGYAVASELKSVMSLPGVSRDVDLTSLEQYLAFDYVVGPRSIFDATKKLPAAHYAEITPDGYEPRAYWAPSARPRVSRRGALERLDTLLDHSVRRRLMADVPVGLFLSGGLDSTTVGHYMRRYSDDVHSFSIGFEEEDFDESRFSSLAAKALGTKHHLEIFSQERLRDLVPRIADVLDEPMGDQSIFPTYLLSTFTRQGVKVALGGDGSDELLMGYKSFLPLKVAWNIDRVPAVRDTMARVARAMPEELGGRRVRGMTFARRIDRPPVRRLLSTLGSFDGDARWVLSADVRAALPPSPYVEPERVLLAGASGFSTSADQTVLAYMRGYMQEDILVKVDRASMATSLEVRSPFLDPDLVDFILALPTSLRLHGRTGKYLLRKLMRGRIPDEVLDRRKVGFGVPLNQWLRESLRDQVIDYLSPDRLRAQGLFDATAVQGLVKDHLSSSSDRGNELWLLLLFQLWFERWAARSPRASDIATATAGV